mmetsp:Transcript_8918/g.17390  ORF Transcript_8918/g.17390 Transcript_8918/m.17390 type:complete len:89 (+) Transcript_8918:309-575(+)
MALQEAPKQLSCQPWTRLPFNADGQSLSRLWIHHDSLSLEVPSYIGTGKTNRDRDRASLGKIGKIHLTGLGEVFLAHQKLFGKIPDKY